MKRLGNKTTRLVAWTLSGSIITASCMNGDSYLDEDDHNTYNQMYERNQAIHISLTREQIEYLKCLSKLSDKIIKDRSFAKSFAKDPNSCMRDYLEQFGIDSKRSGFNIMEDESLFKIVNALTDDDIAMAIKENNVKNYLLLMYKKGYLETSSKINDYNNLLSIEEKKNLLKSIGLEDPIAEEAEHYVMAAAVVALFYAAAAVVSWVAVAYTVLGFINAATTATVLTYAGAITETKVKTSGLTSAIELGSNFDVYMLSASEKNKEIVFGDKNLNKSIRDIADAFSEMFKEDAKNVDSEMLEQIIKINLSKQEMIR